MDLAKMLEPIKDEIDTKIAIAAMQNALAGGKTQLSDAEADAVRKAFQQRMQQKQAEESAAKARKNIADGEEFLATNQTKPAVKRTEELRAGTGVVRTCRSR